MEREGLTLLSCNQMGEGNPCYVAIGGAGSGIIRQLRGAASI